jgi:hypothetical protein
MRHAFIVVAEKDGDQLVRNKEVLHISNQGAEEYTYNEKKEG